MPFFGLGSAFFGFLMLSSSLWRDSRPILPNVGRFRAIFCFGVSLCNLGAGPSRSTVGQALGVHSCAPSRASCIAQWPVVMQRGVDRLINVTLDFRIGGFAAVRRVPRLGVADGVWHGGGQVGRPAFPCRFAGGADVPRGTGLARNASGAHAGATRERCAFAATGARLHAGVGVVAFARGWHGGG